MKGIVVAGSFIKSDYDIGKYYLYYENYRYYICKDKLLTNSKKVKKLISKSTIKTFETVFTEVKYDKNDKMYFSYLVSIVFKDGTDVLLDCDAKALRRLTIELY